MISEKAVIILTEKSAEPNENIVQNHLNIDERILVFKR